MIKMLRPVVYATIIFFSSSANAQVNNFTANCINRAILPCTDSTLDIGTTTRGWKNIYLNNSIYLNGVRSIGAPGISNFFAGTNALMANTTGKQNTAVGRNALSENTGGDQNTALGEQALAQNTSGNINTAVGQGALAANTEGSLNTAAGYGVMVANTTGSQNTATGGEALAFNTTGESNTATGAYALYGNTTGTFNTGNGYLSLYSGSWGSYNTASGYQALTQTEGNNNTAIGVGAGFNNVTGYNNTFLGYGADASTHHFHNVTAIGYNAIANASNKMQLGSSTTVLASTGGIVIVSDGRFKEKIKTDDVPGLDFIMQLQPVSYNFNYTRFDDFLRKNINATDATGISGTATVQNISRTPIANKATQKQTAEDEAYQQQLNEKSKLRQIGFIAQDVDKITTSSHYTFNGVYTPQNDNDNYALDYSLFVVPLVKAVQELNRINNEKDSKIDNLQKQIDELKLLIERPVTSKHP